MTDLIIPGIISSVVGFIVVYLSTPPLIKYLQTKNLLVRDINKPGNVMIARPGGPSIILGIVSSEIILYIFFHSNEILAITITSILGFLVGYIDDKRIMGRWFKPIALAVIAVPILLLGTYDPNLEFPPFGAIYIPVIYVGVVIFMILVIGNTINSIDVLNGAASGFMVIAGFSLCISLFLLQNYEMALASLPIALVSLAFYKYHKIPSRIFPGDSGALALGVMYAAVAIVGDVEVIAAIALLPAILNSFLFLSSVKRIVEHRQLRIKPVEHTKDMKLKASTNVQAPITLVRLIVTREPLSEEQVTRIILKMAVFSGALAIMTALMAVLI